MTPFATLLATVWVTLSVPMSPAVATLTIASPADDPTPQLAVDARRRLRPTPISIDAPSEGHGLAPLSADGLRQWRTNRYATALRDQLLADSTRDQTLDTERLAMIPWILRLVDGGDPTIPRAIAGMRLEQTARLLLCEGVSDPWVLLALGPASLETGMLMSVDAALEQAMSEFAATNSSPVARIVAGMILRQWSHARNVEPAFTAAANDLLAEAVLELLDEPTDDPIEWQWRTELAADAIEGAPPRTAASLARAISERTALPEVLRETAAGAFEMTIAWGERGSGWASSVSASEMQEFATRLSKAALHFVRAWQADPSLPSAPVRMIGVAMAGGAPDGEDESVWFQRALAAQFDNASAYESMRWALRPRWGGSRASLESLGAACLATKRFDTLVPGVYMGTLHDVVQESGGEMEVLRDPAILQRARDAVVGTLAETSHERRQDMRRELSTGLAVVLHANRAWEELFTLVTSEGFEFDRATAAPFGVSREGVTHDAWALGGPLREEVAAADALVKSGKHDEAVATLNQLIKVCEERSLPLDLEDALIDRRIRATFEHALADGAWHELPSEPGLLGYRPLLGQWGVASDGKVTCAMGVDRAILELPPGLGRRFAFKIQGNAHTNSQDLGPGMLIGLTFGDVPEYQWVGVEGGENEIGIATSDASEPWWVGHVATPAPEPDGTSGRTPRQRRGGRNRFTAEFEVQVWDDSVIVKHGDEVLLAGALPKPETDPWRDHTSTRVAFGTHRPGYATLRVQLENIVVRRLLERPKELAAKEVRP